MFSWFYTIFYIAGSYRFGALYWKQGRGGRINFIASRSTPVRLAPNLIDEERAPLLGSASDSQISPGKTDLESGRIHRNGLEGSFRHVAGFQETYQQLDNSTEEVSNENNLKEGRQNSSSSTSIASPAIHWEMDKVDLEHEDQIWKSLWSSDFDQVGTALEDTKSMRLLLLKGEVDF